MRSPTSPSPPPPATTDRVPPATDRLGETASPSGSGAGDGNAEGVPAEPVPPGEGVPPGYPAGSLCAVARPADAELRAAVAVAGPAPCRADAPPGRMAPGPWAPHR